MVNGEEGGTLGDLDGGGGGVLGISGVRGVCSSCLPSTGLGDNGGGLGPGGVVATVADLGGRRGRVGVGGGTSVCVSSSSEGADWVWGDSTVITGFPLDAETVRRSCLGVVGN